MNSTLSEMVARFRSSEALKSKASLRLVAEVFGATDWTSGPGDDAAVVEYGEEQILVAGEAIWPPLIERDPFGAGVASVVANVNDVAAMGGRALALVDQVVAPEPVARRVLEGIKFAAGIYGVPVVGGHLTIAECAPSVAASIVGSVIRPLAATRVAPGMDCLLACCLEGALREDFPYFSSIRHRAEKLAGDVALLPSLAEQGLVAAAKDVSMAGILGSLAMLLEPARCGALVDLASIPMPDGVPLAMWTSIFPTYAFLLATAPSYTPAVVSVFEKSGLTCARIGTIDDSGKLRAHLGEDEAELLDLNSQIVTGLGDR